MISLQEWRERAAPLNEDAPQGYNYDRAAGAAGFARPGSHHADQALATKLATILRTEMHKHPTPKDLYEAFMDTLPVAFSMAIPDLDRMSKSWNSNSFKDMLDQMSDVSAAPQTAA